jgi:hypothetical protein
LSEPIAWQDCGVLNMVIGAHTPKNMFAVSRRSSPSEVHPCDPYN